MTRSEMTCCLIVEAGRRLRARSRIVQSTLGGCGRPGRVWKGAALAPALMSRIIRPYGLYGISSLYGIHGNSVSRIHEIGNVPAEPPGVAY